MLWIFAGHVLLFPIIGAIHIITMILQLGNLPPSETLVLVPSEAYKSVNIVPSMWLTQISFFFGYVFMNAKDVYSAEPVDPAKEYASKVNNRKARTIMIMVCAAVALVGLVVSRVIAGSESAANLTVIVTAISVTVSVALGLSAAAIWDTIGGQPNVGIGKFDIFGISQQMMKIPKTEQVTLCQTASL